MSVDTKLNELKNKSIDDLTLSEKFTLIQHKFGQTSVDYKNRWWLDIIYDNHISQLCGYQVFSFKNTTRVVILVGDVFSNKEDNIEYISELKDSSRHDAMLNALTLYSKLD